MINLIKIIKNIAQNILKQNLQYQLQIQQNQQMYDLLNLKINNNALYQKLYNSNNSNKQNINKEVIKPKSILKSNKDNMHNLNFDGKKQLQINIEKNEIKEIPPNENKKSIILQKKIIQNNKNIITPKKEEIINKIEESDEDLMKEFQSTIGSLQKLLM